MFGSRLTDLPVARHTLLDNAPAEVGIDQTLFGAGDRLMENKVINPLLPGETREILGLENPQDRASDAHHIYHQVTQCMTSKVGLPGRFAVSCL